MKVSRQVFLNTIKGKTQNEVVKQGNEKTIAPVHGSEGRHQTAECCGRKTELSRQCWPSCLGPLKKTTDTLILVV